MYNMYEKIKGQGVHVYAKTNVHSIHTCIVYVQVSTQLMQIKLKIYVDGTQIEVVFESYYY